MNYDIMLFNTYQASGLGKAMLFNATFNSISVITWLSVLYGGGNRNTWRKPS